MRRALVCAFAVLGLSAQPALALQPGAPRDVRTARPADANPRPGSRLEEWSIQLVDPRSAARIGVRIVRNSEEGSGVQVVVQDRGQPLPLAFAVTPAARGRLAWTGPEGSARVTRRGDTWTLQLSSQTASGVIRLRRARPGVTARRWRLGAEAGYAKNVNVSWSAPVGTSRVTGRLRARDRSLDLRGWRATLEHSWGNIDRAWQAWDHLATGVVHTRGGAWLLQGMNRRDLLTGSGARDAFWLGLLVHVTPARTIFCRPRMVRRGWLVGLDGPVGVTTVRAGCGGRRVRFRRLADTSAGREGSGWVEDESRAAAAPRGAAWLRYAGHTF